MESPLISIIITAYNYGQTLKEAVDSACAQDYPNLEVLVLDNASTDATPDVMQHYQHDPRLRYLRNPHNIGATRNHNRGIIESHGEYINFLSADDRLAPNLLSTSYQYLKSHPEVDIVYSELNTMNASSTYTGRRHSHNPTTHNGNPHEFASFLSFGCYAAFETMLIPRWVFGIYGLLDEKLIGADFEIMIRWAAVGLNFGYIPEAMLTYRLHDNQDSGHDKFITTGSYLIEFLYILDKHLTDENTKKIQGYEYRILRHIHAKHDIIKKHGYQDNGELEERVSTTIKKLQEIRKIHDAALLPPACTIIVIADRTENDLNRTLSSLAQQSYLEWEALIIYDALDTQPHTPDTLSGRARIIQLTEDLTKGQALNIALRIAKGNCYTFLQAGNTFPSDHLARLIWSFSNHPLDAYLTPATLMIHDGYDEYAYPVFSHPGHHERTLVAPSCPLEALAFRREVIDRFLTFNPEMNILSEWNFLLRLQNHLNIGVLTNSTVYIHEMVGHANRYIACSQLLEDIQKAYSSLKVHDERISFLRSLFLQEIEEYAKKAQGFHWTQSEHYQWYELLAGEFVIDSATAVLR